MLDGEITDWLRMTQSVAERESSLLQPGGRVRQECKEHKGRKVGAGGGRAGRFGRAHGFVILGSRRRRRKTMTNVASFVKEKRRRQSRAM